ncbi:MAG TPA: hypothetical protein VHO03_03730 [Ignavibacteriales bacterium]|nr:hypothetical protein [Ignavibacteriales bacterium]
MARNYWTTCKHCGKQIVWLKNKGKNVPVNLESIPRADRQSLMMELTVDYDPMLHTKHFDTCPHYVKTRTNFAYLRY